MYPTILLVLFVINSALAGPLISRSVRLVNGINATDGEFPYAVSVRYNNCHQCGGTIIGDKWVLTAAHCIFEGYISISSILYGTVLLQNCNATSSNVTRKVRRAIVHENYQPYGGYFNDIGLMEVDFPFEFSSKAQPVILPEQDVASPTFTNAILVGWGYPKEDIRVVAPVLQMVNLVIFPDNECSSFFQSNFSESSHICSGVPGGGTGQCTGDSGGALTVKGVQYGIVSWSDKPCAITPGVLTRVASFRNWIRDHTGI